MNAINATARMTLAGSLPRPALAFLFRVFAKKKWSQWRGKPCAQHGERAARKRRAGNPA